MFVAFCKLTPVRCESSASDLPRQDGCSWEASGAHRREQDAGRLRCGRESDTAVEGPWRSDLLPQLVPLGIREWLRTGVTVGGETGRPADDQVGVPFLNPLFLYLAPKIWGNFVPSTLQL